MVLSTIAKEAILENMPLLRSLKFHKFIENIYNKFENEPGCFADIIEFLDDKGLREKYLKDIYKIYPSMYVSREFDNFIIPDNIYSIGEYAFYDCSELEWIDIPKSVTKIDENAFLDCNNLVELRILNPDCNIAEDAFDGCESNLRWLTIPSKYSNKLTKIFGDSFNESNVTIIYI